MPLTRPVSVADIPPQGLDVEVVVDEGQRRVLAEEFDLPGIDRVEGRFHLTTLSGDRVRVRGTVGAQVRQTCVVTLEPIESTVEESVDMTFAPEGSAPELQEGEDPPDILSRGTIDLGALTSEFFALGLDPYPRKPDANFSGDDDRIDRESPFAALDRIRKPNEADR